MSTVTLIVLAAAAFILWHSLPEAKPQERVPMLRRDLYPNIDERGWQAVFYNRCESPAEIAFLKAMLIRHSLKPVQGSLRGNGLVVDLQAGENGYRVDFLINEWLVVEIDGAAYHSSRRQRLGISGVTPI